MQGMAEIAQAGTPQQIRSASDIATGVGFQGVGAGMDVARGFRPPMQFSEYQAGDIGTQCIKPVSASLGLMLAP